MDKIGILSRGEAMKGRYKLNEDDFKIINKAKEEISYAIEQLVERGVRDVNIHIELVEHIKNCLKE